MDGYQWPAPLCANAEKEEGVCVCMKECKYFCRCRVVFLCSFLTFLLFLYFSQVHPYLK